MGMGVGVPGLAAVSGVLGTSVARDSGTKLTESLVVGMFQLLPPPCRPGIGSTGTLVLRHHVSRRGVVGEWMSGRRSHAPRPPRRG